MISYIHVLRSMVRKLFLMTFLHVNYQKSCSLRNFSENEGNNRVQQENPGEHKFCTLYLHLLCDGPRRLLFLFYNLNRTVSYYCTTMQIKQQENI